MLMIRSHFLLKNLSADNNWQLYFVRKRCNQTFINHWLKWTCALQSFLTGQALPITQESSCTPLCDPAAPCVRQHHMCPAWRDHESLSYGDMSHALSTDVEGTVGVSILIELTRGNDFDVDDVPGRSFLKIWLICRRWLIFPLWDIFGPVHSLWTIWPASTYVSEHVFICATCKRVCVHHPCVSTSTMG